MAGRHYSKKSRSAAILLLFILSITLLFFIFSIFYPSSSTFTVPKSQHSSSVDYSFVSSLQKFLATKSNPNLLLNQEGGKDDETIVQKLDNSIWDVENQRLYNQDTVFPISLPIRVYVYKALKVRTVKVTNVSFSASEQDIKEFFSFSGVIEYVEINSESERSQVAYVTFNDPQGAETAVLLSGSTIVDQSVTISFEPTYQLPPSAQASLTSIENQGLGGAVLFKAEDVVSSMLAKGFILGKDAVNKAKTFDEKLQITSTASSLDQKIGLSEKISTGATLVTDKMKEVDEKFQVSDKTKSAFAAAEQTVSTAGSAIMKNRYILTGTSWVTGAFSRVTKAAAEVGQKTKEKMDEEEEGRNAADSYAKAQEFNPPKAAASEQSAKPSSPKSLIL